MTRYIGSLYFHKHTRSRVAFQQHAADHSHTMGQDEARQGTLSPYLKSHRTHVRVGASEPVLTDCHGELAVKQKWSRRAVTSGTFSSIVYLIIVKTLEQVRIPRNPPTDLGQMTISRLDPLVM
jgi:hypothetical protein